MLITRFSFVTSRIFKNGPGISSFMQREICSRRTHEPRGIRLLLDSGIISTAFNWKTYCSIIHSHAESTSIPAATSTYRNSANKRTVTNFAHRIKMAQRISGTEVSKQIQLELKDEVAKMAAAHPGYQPGLAIVQVGGREDSNVYIRMKIKAAQEIGINATHHQLPRTITEAELLTELDKLNRDPKVHGIIVQMPLDSDNKIDSHKVTDAVDPGKDVDGLCTINEGRVAIGDLKSGFMPCTPYGCIELIKRTGVSISGAKAVVLGRSKIVGTPVAELLKWHDATVTVCHSRTKNISEEVKAADILVVGIGRPEMVKGDWVKPGAVVIDCGINSIPDATKKSGQRLVGDVAYDEVSQVAGFITPVPGGVGPMTVCMLMKNTVISAAKALKDGGGGSWNLTPLSLTTKDPVPT